MKKTLSYAICLSMLLSVVSLVSAQDDGWISLFDGKSFKGWKASENQGTFKIEDGCIVVNGERSHLFYVGPVCDHMFKDFEFKAEVMTKPGSNAGIYFHTKYQQVGWPSHGYECQVNQTHPDQQKTGGLYDAAKVNPAPAKDNQWYTQHIIVKGNHVVVKINGKVVTDYTEPKDVNFRGWPHRRLSKGTFALQGHDPRSVVYFRNIMVKPLVVVDDSWIRLDNGKDFTGWKKTVESPGTFTFNAQEKAFVANGNRSHLFYEGPVQNADFKNFEFVSNIKTLEHSNGGLFFHTAYQESGWPSQGFEVQVNNSYDPDPRKTASLYRVSDLMNKVFVSDNEYYAEYFKVCGDEVTIKLNDLEVNNWLQTDEWKGQKLGSGTFALQGHDPGSTVFYKDIYVKPLDPDPALRGKWVDLFDGKTLKGWTQRNGYASYRVENGQIIGTTAEGSPNSFLCTDKMYGDFELQFEVKVDSRLNSGVQIRSNSYKNYRDWRVHGYQVEIAANGNSGLIYDEARRAKWLNEDINNPAAKAAFKNDQWNKFKVVCVGDSIKTWVNGVPVTDIKDSVTACGFIGLQVHQFRSDSPADVSWKNIRIKDLTGVKKKIKVALLTGGHAFDEKEFFELFDNIDSIDYTHHQLKDDSEIFEDISGWDYDVIVMYNMSKTISKKRQDNFIKLLDKGVGLVAMHHAVGAYQDWDEYKNIIGAKYYTQANKDNHIIGKFKHDVDVPVKVVSDHSIVSGARDFVIHDETYKDCWFSKDAKVLLKADHETSDPIVCLVKKYKNANVCYYQLGHDKKAYSNPSFIKILTQAIAWAAD